MFRQLIAAISDCGDLGPIDFLGEGFEQPDTILAMLRRAGDPSLLDKRGKDDARRIQIFCGGNLFAARHLQHGSNATATADKETKLKPLTMENNR